MAHDDSSGYEAPHLQLLQLLDDLIERLRPIVDARDTPPSDAGRILREELESLRAMRSRWSPNPSTQRSVLDDPAGENAKPKLRLLTVTADVEVTQVIEIVGKRLDLEHLGVATTAAALRLIETFPANVVLVDLWSSVTGQSDLMTELRTKNHRPMPIGIAMSNASKGQSAEAMKAGYHAFLVKPLTLESTLIALATADRLLRKRSSRARKSKAKL